MASGAGLKQIIVVPAGLPGAANSCYSALQSVSVASKGTANGTTVITDIGELLFMPVANSNVSLSLQTAAGVWTGLGVPTTTVAAQFFSDGTNLRFENADTTTTRSGTYYIIQ